jgi:hypothetical protein
MSPAQHHLHIDAKGDGQMDPVADARALVSSGKWLLRELRAADPVLADRLVAAHDQSADLAELAELVLARGGGRLSAGYRQQGKL